MIENSLANVIANTDERRKRDSQRWEEQDQDLCMLCGARGPDKRSLFLSCFYDINELIPEAIDLYKCPDESLQGRGFYMRICKACRGDLLSRLGEWRDARLALRSELKNHDGNLDYAEPERNIPYRVNGAVVMLTREEWEETRRV